MIQNYEFEINYIYDSPCGSKNNIRAYCPGRESKHLPNTYNIKCHNLPKGTYSLKNKKVNFHFNTQYEMVYGDMSDSLREYFENWGNFSFKVLGDCEFILQVKRCKRKDIEPIVVALREQALKNYKKSQQKQESLIQKDIKKHTDLGEEYNRTSFEETILDYFNDDEDLVVDLSKSAKDIDVKYLQLMKLMQDKNRYEIKQQKLDMESMELAIRENKLLNQ
ncbi:MAG: hypothetical protein ACLRFE_03685 [Clostridia bacterium]